MYLQKVISRKNSFCWHLEGQRRKYPDPLVRGADPDPLVRGADPDSYQNVTDPQRWSPYFQFKKWVGVQTVHTEGTSSLYAYISSIALENLEGCGRPIASNLYQM
jgi:hypothetical protein